MSIKDYLYFNVDKPQYNLKDINVALGLLIGSKLVKGDAKIFFLTEEGEQAVRMGYAEYCAVIDKEKTIRKNIDITTLITNYWNIANCIVIIITFVAGVLLSPLITEIINKLITFFSS